VTTGDAVRAQPLVHASGHGVHMHDWQPGFFRQTNVAFSRAASAQATAVHKRRQKSY
jgi:hypothetical protein